MIVVCSPQTAGSEWVFREIQLFRSVHGGHAVLAALVEGTGPESLRAVLGGPSVSPLVEPLAADFSRKGDGERLALLKLVAVLAGVRLDELVQRDAQRRIRNAMIAGSAAFCGMCVMGVLTFALLRAQASTVREQARSGALIEYMLTDIRTRLQGVGRLDLLDAVNQGALAYYASQTLSKLSNNALMQRAELLQAVGADNERRGKLDEASASFVEAKRTTDALLLAAPDDPKRILMAGRSEFYVGMINWRLGVMDEAEAHFRAYLHLAKRLVQVDPDNPDYLVEKGDASANLGMFFMRQSLDLDHAEPLFLETLADFRQAALQRNDTDVQMEIADAYGWLGDVERLRGNCEGAYMDRRKFQTTIAALPATDHANADVKTLLVANGLAMARIYLCRGDLDRALGELRARESEAERLAQMDQTDLAAQRQVRILRLFEAKVVMSRLPKSGPGSAVAAPTVGDCTLDGTMLHSEELQTFCRILDARSLLLRGDKAAANRELEGIDFSSVTRRGRLSERWGLDFKDEARQALLQ